MKYNKALDALTNVLSGHEDLTSFLDVCAAATNCLHAQFLVANVNSGSLVRSEVSSGCHKEYSVWETSTWSENPRVRALLTAKPHTVLTGKDLLPPDLKRLPEKFSNAYRKFGIDYTLVVRFDVNEECLACLVLGRDSDFTQYEIDCLQGVIGALMVSVRVLAQMREVNPAEILTLFAQDKPALILNQSGRILATNAQFDTYATTGRVTLENGQFLSQPKSFTEALDIVRRDVGATHRLVHKVKDSQIPVVFVLMSLNDTRFGPGLKGCVLLTVNDPTNREISKERLQDLLGLSPAEADVGALLATGLRPSDIAIARQSKESTVRTQIKLLRSKLGVDSQAELISVLWSV